MEQVKTADKQIDEFLPEIYKKLEWLSKEELIKKFVSVEFNRFLEYYKNAPDLNVQADRRPEYNREPAAKHQVTRQNRSDNRNDTTEDHSKGSQGAFSRFYINI